MKEYIYSIYMFIWVSLFHNDLLCYILNEYFLWFSDAQLSFSFLVRLLFVFLVFYNLSNSDQITAQGPLKFSKLNTSTSIMLTSICICNLFMFCILGSQHHTVPLSGGASSVPGIWGRQSGGPAGYYPPRGHHGTTNLRSIR